ncbi:unnamed protein product [Linum trigynum]|uniref:Secreted protein n=1 Tax=Linum trigynum TaxID=586398 RepID=A0AAV2F3A7_9ROSI
MAQPRWRPNLSLGAVVFFLRHRIFTHSLRLLHPFSLAGQLAGSNFAHPPTSRVLVVVAIPLRLSTLSLWSSVPESKHLCFHSRSRILDLN